MPTRFLKLLVVSLMAAVLSSACGGGKPNAKAPSAAETHSATTAQYASIVAKNSDISDQLETMQSCNWFSSGGLDAGGSIVCMAGVLTLSYQSSTLAVSLESASKEGVPAYIGAPPAEIAQLVADTIRSAKSLETASAAANDSACTKSNDGNCQELRAGVVQGMDALVRELRAWGPYL